MEDTEQTGTEQSENEPSFELTAEQATGFGDTAAPGQLNRKRTLIIICVGLSVVIGGGLVMNTIKSSNKKTSQTADITAADSQSSFLTSLMSRAARERAAEQPPPPQPEPDEPESDEPLLPPVLITRENYPPPQQQPVPASGGGPPAPVQDMTPVYASRLVPPVDGSLFASGSYQPQATAGAAAGTPGNANSYSPNPYYSGQTASDYTTQNDQQGKNAFYDSSDSGGVIVGGRFLGPNSIWTGTIIPGILETAINTDLPGNVLARVTRNIYDSLTGRKLLIPQGSILIAKYNSSVSYAQHRVQIVWDTLIRPDGFQLDLDGMNSVDRAGMSGQEAEYHENWFEYLKAAGILTMFSLANARMTEAAAKYASDASASAIAGSNSEMVNQLGGNMVGRAMNIQPTLTVDNGTLINILLNKTLYLPPIDGFPMIRR